MENSWEEKKKSFNFFQRFLMVAVIPSLFAIIVLVLLLMYSGADVAEKGKALLNTIPFLSEEKKSTDKLLENNKNKMLSLQTKLEERDAQIKTLESQLENSENRIQSVNSEKEKLQSELISLQSAQEETKKAVAEIVKTYDTMSPKNAAAILSEMSENEALKILAELKPAKLASILEKMEPSIASKYTERLADNATVNP
ncbi:MotE family protein [Niallia sp. JL1B1071]|uniref:MotE family protein n=1 Tax=Niallia tiangongensis TaxID=3237105 RepID=UPI0037DC7F93